MSSNNDIRKNGLLNKNNSNPNKKILIKVNLSNQNQKQIEIDNNFNNICDISFEFCKKYNLDYQTLVQMINELETIKKNNNKYNNNYEISLDKNTQNNIYKKVQKISKKINKVVKEEDEENMDSSSRSKKHIIPIKKNQKLFPYEFKIKKNFSYKNKKKNNNKEITQDSINSFYNRSNQLSNKGNISSTMNLNNLSSIEGNQTVNTLKPMNTISNFSRISSNNNFKKLQNNIFERLFNDAQIKRVAYRRPCHFSSDLRENNVNNNNKINSSHILDGNSILFSNTNLTLLSNNSYRNDNNKNYNNSYLLRSINTLNPECIFQPNSILKRNKSVNNKRKNHKRNKEINNSENNLNNLDYKPIIIKDGEISNEKNKMFNTISGTNEKYRNDNKNNIYIPLKNRISWGINQSELLLEGESNDAFENLFYELNDNNGNELNDKNINVEKIPTNILYDIEPITSEIYKNKKNYSIEVFKNEMKEIINRLPKEDKRNIIKFYKNKNNNIYLNTGPNNNKLLKEYEKNKNLLNKSKGMHMENKSVQYLIEDENNNKNNYSFFNHSARKNKINYSLKHNRLPSGIEKKRNFFYL